MKVTPHDLNNIVDSSRQFLSEFDKHLDNVIKHLDRVDNLAGKDDLYQKYRKMEENAAKIDTLFHQAKGYLPFNISDAQELLYRMKGVRIENEEVKQYLKHATDWARYSIQSHGHLVEYKAVKEKCEAVFDHFSWNVPGRLGFFGTLARWCFAPIRFLNGLFYGVKHGTEDFVKETVEVTGNAIKETKKMAVSGFKTAVNIGSKTGAMAGAGYAGHLVAGPLAGAAAAAAVGTVILAAPHVVDASKACRREFKQFKEDFKDAAATKEASIFAKMVTTVATLVWGGPIPAAAVATAVFGGPYALRGAQALKELCKKEKRSEVDVEVVTSKTSPSGTVEVHQSGDDEKAPTALVVTNPSETLA